MPVPAAGATHAFCRWLMFLHRLAYSPDGKLLATLSRDNSVKIWDAQTGREVRSSPVDVTIAGCVAFSPDGNPLVNAESEELRIYDATPLPEEP